MRLENNGISQNRMRNYPELTENKCFVPLVSKRGYFGQAGENLKLGNQSRYRQPVTGSLDSDEQ